MTEENPIIEEIRQTRERLLVEHNGNLAALVASLQKSSAARTPIGQSGLVSPDKPNLHASVIIKKVG